MLATWPAGPAARCTRATGARRSGATRVAGSRWPHRRDRVDPRSIDPAAINSPTNHGLPPDTGAARRPAGRAGAVFDGVGWRQGPPPRSSTVRRARRSSRVRGRRSLRLASRRGRRSAASSSRSGPRSPAACERGSEPATAPRRRCVRIVDDDQQGLVAGHGERVGDRSEGDKPLQIIARHRLIERRDAELLEDALPRPERWRAAVVHPAPHAHRNPWSRAIRTTSAASRVLPMPAGPTRHAAPPTPSAAAVSIGEVPSRRARARRAAAGQWWAPPRNPTSAVDDSHGWWQHPHWTVCHDRVTPSRAPRPSGLHPKGVVS